MVENELVSFIESGHKRRGIVTKCVICSKLFIKRRQYRNNRGKYCSPECRGIGRRNRLLIKCAICNKEHFRSKSKTRNSKSGLYFCNRLCKEKAQSLVGGIKEIMPPHYGTGKVQYRKFFDENSLQCSRCRYNEFSCSVQIHHIDRNRDNNNPENLMQLCANCHSALHNNKWKLEDITNG